LADAHVDHDLFQPRQREDVVPPELGRQGGNDFLEIPLHQPGRGDLLGPLAFAFRPLAFALGSLAFALGPLGFGRSFFAFLFAHVNKSTINVSRGRSWPARWRPARPRTSCNSVPS